MSNGNKAGSTNLFLLPGSFHFLLRNLCSLFHLLDLSSLHLKPSSLLLTTLKRLHAHRALLHMTAFLEEVYLDHQPRLIGDLIHIQLQ